MTSRPAEEGKPNMLQIQPTLSDCARWEEYARRHGLCYEILELSLSPALGDPALAEQGLAAWRGSGLVRGLHGAFIDINPASADPEIRRLSRRRCAMSCALARELGAERVIFHGSAFPFLRGAYLEGWAESCAEFYTGLREEYGLAICIENSQDLDCTPLALLMERAGGALCACLDVGHAHYSRAGLEDWFEALGPYIACLHLSDNMGRFDDHLAIGAGSVDWGLAHRLWGGLGKPGLPITLEVGSMEQIEQSLAYLSAHGYMGQGV